MNLDAFGAGARRPRQDSLLLGLSQRDALKWMNAKNVPGFTDEVIDTYARKVEGDISLAQEVIDSRMDPTAGQQFLNQMNMIKFSLKGEIVYRALFASLGV